jgi:hypothetical protein
VNFLSSCKEVPLRVLGEESQPMMVVSAELDSLGIIRKMN